MTRDEAYAAGFCKAAEALGVDPEALYKQALPAWMGRALSRARGFAGRYNELLTGSRFDRLSGEYSSLWNKLHPDRSAIPKLTSRLEAITKLRDRELKGVIEGGTGVMDRVNRLNARAESVRRQLAAVPSLPTRADVSHFSRRLKGVDAERTREFWKSMGARVGTGGVMAGGIYAVDRAIRGGQPSGYQAQPQE